MAARSIAAGAGELSSSHSRLWIGVAIWSILAQTARASHEVEERAKVAHAVLGSVAWAFIFPVGALVMRLAKGTKVWFFHACIQTLGLILVVVGAGNGIYVALTTDQLNNYHPIIGLVLLSITFIQAAGGILGHMLWTKHKRRNIIGRVHAWLGRAIITLGIISGGLGLLLSGDGTAGDYIAYGVVAGVIWLVVVGNAVLFELKKKPTQDDTGDFGGIRRKPGAEVD